MESSIQIFTITCEVSHDGNVTSICEGEVCAQLAKFKKSNDFVGS